MIIFKGSEKGVWKEEQSHSDDEKDGNEKEFQAWMAWWMSR